jgi:plasmid stabilization system protein ParE
VNFQLTAAAIDDVDDIWAFIAADSVVHADRVRDELWVAFARLAEEPGLGHKREDLTSRNLLFLSLYSYLIVYRSDRDPIQIVRVVSGCRDVAQLL